MGEPVGGGGGVRTLPCRIAHYFEPGYFSHHTRNPQAHGGAAGAMVWRGL